MKAPTTPKEQTKAKFERALRFRFAPRELPLTWSGQDGETRCRSDCYRWLNEDTLLVLEVENQQQHSDTNVSKYWPWLTQNATKRVFLIQSYTRKNMMQGHRGQLAAWLAQQMQKSLSGRFEYARRLVPLGRNRVEGVTALRQQIASFRGIGRATVR